MAVDSGTVQVVMPAMGESVAEGTILEWRKAEGDTVAVDETLVEISTDKVDAEVPSPVSGTIVKLHGAEGDTVTVGAVLAEIAPAEGGNGDAPSAGAPAAESNGDAADAGAPAAESNGDESAETAPSGDETATEGKTIDIVAPA